MGVWPGVIIAMGDFLRDEWSGAIAEKKIESELFRKFLAFGCVCGGGGGGGRSGRREEGDYRLARFLIGVSRTFEVWKCDLEL